MEKFNKSLVDKISDNDIDSGGTFSFCGWERLKPLLEQACNLKPNEKLVGVRVHKGGIDLKIEYK